MKLKTRRIILAVCLAVILLVSFKILTIYIGLNAEKASSNNISCSMFQRPFYNGNYSKRFIAKNNVELRLWAKNLTGTGVLTITDEKEQVVFTKDFKQIENDFSLDLKPNIYNINVAVKNYTGGVYVGLKNTYPIYKLPNANYEIVNSNINKGFNYQYILFTPTKVNHKNILVMPNNTGLVCENIEIHKNSAISLAIKQAQLATKLGVPLLVPIFPRTEVMDTHSLDRITILVPDNERLDLQLIAMVKDCQKRLKDGDINVANKILMFGFSASGDFTDRFSFLHPELVKATVIGGCNNMVPLKTFKGENLPYPIGVYDYQDITGKDFNINTFKAINRFIYKGSKDEGGWQVITNNGKTNTYTWLEYYNKFITENTKKLSQSKPTPVYVKGNLSDQDNDVILHRVYNKVLLERFKIIKDLYANKGLSNSEFRIYENVKHEITTEIANDIYEFLKDALNE
ncbi:hypothetical protein IMX26_12045 [Clostridium sp. 'deep sea']|uniref:hypothetical protein n=1 Tax=Clostridium sp. 'deep sea' TaxID=2779445 RepID=UPI0018969149|nr:hypothetical protein [Clostridium sp. 'deep sea']QOR34219.1 hypothetical protein IMX26_12045 [Clostridium sp. 'deep sea']